MISIHAPVKGATLYASYTKRMRDDISIHAPVKGATRQSRSVGRSMAYFNPRTREGCDAKNYMDKSQNDPISIHAPVKGATSTISEVSHVSGISIHAPVKGATPLGRPFFHPSMQFQSTHP
mgnify:CR=1 FL=1